MFWLVVIIIAYIVQFSILPHFVGVWLRFDIFLVLTVLIGLLQGMRNGMALGLVLGLLHDIAIGSSPGFFTGLYLIAGCAAGWFASKIFKGNIFVPLIVIIFWSILEAALLWWRLLYDYGQGLGQNMVSLCIGNFLLTLLTYYCLRHWLIPKEYYRLGD